MRGFSLGLLRFDEGEGLKSRELDSIVSPGCSDLEHATRCRVPLLADDLLRYQGERFLSRSHDSKFDRGLDVIPLELLSEFQVEDVVGGADLRQFAKLSTRSRRVIVADDATWWRDVDSGFGRTGGFVRGPVVQGVIAPPDAIGESAENGEAENHVAEGGGSARWR